MPPKPRAVKRPLIEATVPKGPSGSGGDPVAYFYAKPPSEKTVRTAYAERELKDSPRDRLFERLVLYHGPAASVIAAFDNWITSVLPQQVAHKSLCERTAIYSFENVRVLKPTHEGAPLFPYQARKFGLTYNGELIVDVRLDPHPGMEDAHLGSRVIARNRPLGKIMIMVGSAACHLRGLSPDEKRLVLEDTSDPGGYFIVRGSERILMNEDGVAFSQAVSRKSGDEGLTTSITSNRVSGQEVVTAKQDARAETAVNILLSPVGTKGSSQIHPEYPVFSLFDVLLQINEPDTYAYEGAGLNSPVRADRLERRAKIVDHAQELINRFVPPEHRERIFHYLSGSRAMYANIERPIQNLAYTKSSGSTIAKIAADALQAAAKRSAAALVTARTRWSPDAELPNTPEQQAALEKAALVAARAAEAAHENSEDPRYETCSSAIVQEFFAEIFHAVPMRDKPLHLARLTAHHCLVQTSVRDVEDLDSWANRRIKQPVDWMAQLINGSLSKITLDRRGSKEYITENSSVLTDAFISSFSMGGNTNTVNAGMRGAVHTVKRDTQIALVTQLGRVTPRAQRKTKQSNIRQIQPTHPGFCCPAETPTGEACGLTKNLACTTSISLRRDRIRYIADIVLPALREVYGPAYATYDEFRRPNAVAVDGQIVGWVDGEEFVRILRPRTKTDLAFFDVTVIFNRPDRVMEVFTTGARPVRPLFAVAGLGRPTAAVDIGDDRRAPLVIDRLGPGAYDLPIPDLIRAGAIEFISPAEQQYYFLVQYPDETGAHVERRRAEVAALPTPELREAKIRRYLDMYSEIDPAALLGVAAGLMPSPDTCQGPRVSYQAAMITQSIGLYHDAYYARDDTFKRIESSRPTYEARMAAPVGLNRAPTGRMFTLAFLGLANNQEDGIVVNRRAFANTHMTKYSTHKVLVRLPPPEVVAALEKGAAVPVGTAFETIERPEEARLSAVGTTRYALFRGLDDSGLPKLGVYVPKGGCILGRTRTTVARDGTAVTKSACEYLGVGEDGVIDRVSVVQGKGERENDGQTSLIVRIRIRQTRPVLPGDKMASRYSQKGTIAAARSNVPAIALGAAPGTPYISGEDPGLGTIETFASLPRVASGPNKGLVPDLFINPACMPSRMTIGKLFEGIASKLSLYTGQRFDATAFRPFTNDDIQAIGDGLAAQGLDDGGYEIMEHNDGRPFLGNAKVFVVTCYYQFLRHTVLDKIQFRSEGPTVSQITHQPLTGRSKEGGLRQGEMEKAALCSWGAAELLRERFMRASDLYVCEVCATCGNLASAPNRVAATGVRECRVCPPGQSNIVTVEATFISLLISRMVSAFCINSPLIGLKAPHRPPDV